MKKVVLDTSVLLSWWNQCRSERKGRTITENQAEGWGKKLSQHQDTTAIVTPVLVEIFGGTTSKYELNLMRAFLRPFLCIDRKRFLPQDWEEAIRMAQRVPRDKKPRHLADCLIRALADRLNHEVLAFDQGFPQ
jgi:predicted nucleic acid-binding protein